MITTAVLLMVAGISFAQVDERARELLEGWVPEADIGEIRTMEQVMTMHMPELDMSTTTRTVIDFENERAVMFTEPTGMVVRYVDGVLSMEAQGMEMPVPPEVAVSFTEIFNEANYVGVLDYEDVTATYDGVVSYADVLTGHQVTYTGGRLQNPAFGGLVDAELRYLFDDSGRMIGVVTETEGVYIVSVLVGEPVVTGMVLFNADLYEVENDVATPFATMSYETVSVNDPVDETLFD